jgi:hypothetical protein
VFYLASVERGISAVKLDPNPKVNVHPKIWMTLKEKTSHLFDQNSHVLHFKTGQHDM